jgi:copper resistance protein C
MPAVPLRRPATLVRIASALLAAMLVALLPAAPARAHNQLVKSDPARDAVLDTPPAEVVLEFVERLNPTYTTIVVTDAQQNRVPASQPEISGNRGTITFAQPLADGTYTVAYRVVSADGHPVQGSYSFTVAAGGASPTPPVAPSEAQQAPDLATAPAAANDAGSASPAAAPDTNGNSGAVLAVVGIGLVVLAVGGGFLLRRRRSEER